MTFEEIQKLIQAELDGEIDAEREAELQQHLAESRELREEYAAQKRLKALLAEDRESIRPPEDLSERIATRVLAASGGAPPARVFRLERLLRPLAAAAVILLLVGGSFWAGRQTTSAREDATRVQLHQDMERVLERNPGITRGELEEIYEPALRKLERIDKDAADQRRQVKSDLVLEVEAFLEKRR